VLAAGGRVSNPAELLARPRLRQLLKEAAEKYPWVVIDSAPVLAVSDSLLLVKHVKSICFVIHAGKTPARVVKRACDQIEHAIAKRPTGIVLNHISHRNSSYYYYYSGDYGKGVYGAAEKST
jgi:Mrp family chromosome partitioning ATPase